MDGPTFDGGKYVRTQSYHAVHQGDNSPSSSDSGTSWQVTDQGLPFTKDFDDGGTGLNKLFLSSVTSFCANANCDGANSEVTSRTYRRYVSEYRGCNKLNGLGDSAGCFQVNAMQRAERTVYPTDGNRYVWTTNTSYDGAGHFRAQTLEDFFDGTSTRSTTTNYTATGRHGRAVVAAAFIQIGLLDPGADRLARGLELLGERLRAAAGSNQADHLLAELLCVWWTCPWHS